MKKIILFFALFSSFFLLSAQTKYDTIYIYRNDGVFNAFLRSDVDSITFSSLDVNGVQRSDMVTQQVWMANSAFRIDISVIDSMKLSKYGTPDKAIDLGLSVKWASCNVGATTPEGYGGYYAWGETEEKSDYSWKTYKYYNSSTDEYINISSNISGTQYDVAHVKWGGSWRMPTHAEFDELYSKCTSTWTTYNGVNGIKFVGPNGNSIFLPAAGGRWCTDVDLRGSYGFFWSGTINWYGIDLAWLLYFSYGSVSPYYYSRYGGFSVRPVSEQ